MKRSEGVSFGDSDRIASLRLTPEYGMFFGERDTMVVSRREAVAASWRDKAVVSFSRSLLPSTPNEDNRKLWDSLISCMCVSHGRSEDLWPDLPLEIFSCWRMEHETLRRRCCREEQSWK